MLFWTIILATRLFFFYSQNSQPPTPPSLNTNRCHHLVLLPASFLQPQINRQKVIIQTQTKSIRRKQKQQNYSHMVFGLFHVPERSLWVRVCQKVYVCWSQTSYDEMCESVWHFARLIRYTLRYAVRGAWKTKWRTDGHILCEIFLMCASESNQKNL